MQLFAVAVGPRRSGRRLWHRGCEGILARQEQVYDE